MLPTLLLARRLLSGSSDLQSETLVLPVLHAFLHSPPGAGRTSAAHFLGHMAASGKALSVLLAAIEVRGGGSSRGSALWAHGRHSSVRARHSGVPGQLGRVSSF